MKKDIRKILVGIFLLVTCLGFSQSKQQSNQKRTERIQQSLSFKSKILNSNVRYSIYLPPDYFTSGKKYPVLFLLHGLTDNETTWLNSGGIDKTADKAITNRVVSPMIIVMPNGGESYYINDYNNKFKFEDMFIEEFIPHIDSSLRTRPGKEFRAIAGLSMGGYGALQLSMRHPDLFSSCVALSAAVRTDEELINMDSTRYFQYFSNLFGPAKNNDERVTAHWKKYSPIHLLKTNSLEKLKSVKYYLDCGDDDYLSTGNVFFHGAMKRVGLPHEFRMRNGEHNWDYWRVGILDGLRFVSENFQR